MLDVVLCIGLCSIKPQLRYIERGAELLNVLPYLLCNFRVPLITYDVLQQSQQF